VGTLRERKLVARLPSRQADLHFVGLLQIRLSGKGDDAGFKAAIKTATACRHLRITPAAFATDNMASSESTRRITGPFSSAVNTRHSSSGAPYSKPCPRNYCVSPEGCSPPPFIL